MMLQVGVKVFLKNEEGKVLLLLRSDKYGKEAGKWDIPGGRIDPGTSLLENLEREVKEETGLGLMSKPILIGAQDILKFEDKHVVRLTYGAETSGTPVLDGVEHTDFKWISPKELIGIEGLDEYVRALLEDPAVVL